MKKISANNYGFPVRENFDPKFDPYKEAARRVRARNERLDEIDRLAGIRPSRSTCKKKKYDKQKRKEKVSDRNGTSDQ